MLKLNILQKQLVDKKYHLLDPLLRIIMYSKETRLSNLIANLDQFTNVYDIKSKQMDLFLGDAEIDTEITTEVWTLEIINPNDMNMIAFMANTSLISEEKIQEKVRD